MANTLGFKNISYTYNLKGYDSIPALINVSIDNIGSGEIICIVGPNGSGKSTLLNYIAGKLPGLPPLNNRIAYIHQDPYKGIVPDLSIIENIEIRSIIENGFSIKKAISDKVIVEVTQLCKKVGFEEIIERFYHPPIALSGGQVQMLNILSAIRSNPSLLLLDEPTSKLDELNKIRVLNLLINITKMIRIPVLCVTHDNNYVNRFADRVITLREGEVVNEKIIRQPMSPRYVGVIRYFKTKSELPEKFIQLKSDWWRSGPEELFPNNYINGDNSKNGYLANKSLSRLERTKREIDGIIKLLSIDVNVNSKLLDIPCGWGRHSIEFAKKGISVIGIDLCQDYINMATQSVIQDRLSNITFCIGDMKDLSIIADNSIDYITNIWTSFGFFQDADENEEVIKEYSRVLKKNGKILIHSDLNPIRVRQGIFDEPNIRKLGNGTYLSVNEYYCAEDSSVYGSWQIENGIENLYKIKIFSDLDWRNIANKYDLEIEGFYGSFDKSELDWTSNSQEFIVVLKK